MSLVGLAWIFTLLGALLCPRITLVCLLLYANPILGCLILAATAVKFGIHVTLSGGKSGD